jgi:anti-sigma B factor antagonist
MHRQTKGLAATDAQISSENKDGAYQMKIAGRITIDSSPELLTAVLGCLQAGESTSLTLDLGEVSYIDTSGLAILLETLRAARVQKKVFRLAQLREQPRYLLEGTRLLHLFEEVSGS